MCEVMHQQARLAAIEKQMIEIIENNLEFKEIFNRLMCMHGIDKVAACAWSTWSLWLQVLQASRSILILSRSCSILEHNKLQTQAWKYWQARKQTLKTPLLVEACCVYALPMWALREDAYPGVDPRIKHRSEKLRLRLKKRHNALKKSGLHANRIRVALARELAECIQVICTM